MLNTDIYGSTDIYGDDALLTSLDCDLQCSAETFQTDYEEDDGKSLDLCEGGAAATSGAAQIRVIAHRTVGAIRLGRCCVLRVHLIEEKDFELCSNGKTQISFNEV